MSCEIMREICLLERETDVSFELDYDGTPRAGSISTDREYQ